MNIRALAEQTIQMTDEQRLQWIEEMCGMGADFPTT